MFSLANVHGCLIHSDVVLLRVDVYARKIIWMKNFTERYINLVVNEFSDVVAGINMLLNKEMIFERKVLLIV